MIPVTLSWAQLQHAAHVGMLRHSIALRNGRHDSYGLDGGGWTEHIEGAVGEFVVSLGLRLAWDPVWRDIDRSRGDVGRLHIRTTTARPGHLLLHRRDPDEALFYLVRGEPLEYEIVGSILARDGKREEHWGDKTRSGRPCFWVPAGALDPAVDAQSACEVATNSA